MTEPAGQGSGEAPKDALGAAFMGGFNGLLGLQIDESTPDVVRAHVTVHEGLLQPYGIVHGGVYASLAESAASLGGATWNMARVPGGRTVGVSNSTSFLRAVRAGTLAVVATPLHRGRTLQLWQVMITDGQDRLVAKSDVQLANLEPTPAG
jgi:1,4-dihydroxy-2-naphthoyl-CoA hydrolase